MTESFQKKLDLLAIQKIGKVTFSEPLSGHTSWEIGGPADLFVEPNDSEQIVKILRFATDNHVPFIVIGQGTNLLFDDAGVRGIVIKVGEEMADISIVGNTICAQGGAWVPQLARKSMQTGLTGLEHCIGIPGTVGGLVMMNGGSQRKGIGENVVNVTVISKNGHLQTLSKDECDFSYRYSALQGTGCVVVAVVLNCANGDIKAIRQEMLEDLRSRRVKFPRKLPNCGSVFLSSQEMHATVGPPGKIIETAGLKGLQVGNAEISSQHANFIINLGRATSADVLTLIKQVRQKILDNIGFELKCEVRYVSPTGKIIPAHIMADQI